MAEAHESGASSVEAESGGISTGWRIFQVVALVSALSWLASYVLFVDGYTALTEGLGGGTVFDTIGGVVFGLSPIVSLVVIAIAVWPEAFSFLNRGDAKAIVARVVIFVIPFLWMANVLLGGSPMVDKLFTVPLEPSNALPVFGGVFLHVVFQHWFQGLVAITIALVPEQFSTLTESPTPAGVQCAVVNCE